MRLWRATDGWASPETTCHCGVILSGWSGPPRALTPGHLDVPSKFLQLMVGREEPSGFREPLPQSPVSITNKAHHPETRPHHKRPKHRQLALQTLSTFKIPWPVYSRGFNVFKNKKF